MRSTASTDLLVWLLRGLNVHFRQKSPNLAQMTSHMYKSNPDIGHTPCGLLTPLNEPNYKMAAQYEILANSGPIQMILA